MTSSTENDGQGMIVNPKPTADNQDWDGDDADRADRVERKIFPHGGTLNTSNRFFAGAL